MEESRGTVVISVSEYEKLVAHRERAKVIINALTQSAELNYRKDGFTFDDSAVDSVFAAVAPELHEARLTELLSAVKRE